MTAVNEWIVREYFEMMGFLVSQPRKYAVQGKHKKAEEEIDLLVQNPLVAEHKMSVDLVWEGTDLKTVARAVVAVRGWHTERFYASTLEQTPEILRFAGVKSMNFAKTLLGEGGIAKILCLPRLPASGELKAKTISVLKDKGVDGIISFQTMLGELVSRVDKNRNYEKSDLLQMIRIFKNYDLLKDSQLELWHGCRPRK